jgi:hypothetical protein
LAGRGNAVRQLGFYDLDKRLEAISAKGNPLEALNSIVPFESFRAEYIPNLARTLV